MSRWDTIVRAGPILAFALAVATGCEDNQAGTISAKREDLKGLQGADADPAVKASKKSRKGRDENIRSPKDLIGEKKS